MTLGSMPLRCGTGCGWPGPRGVTPPQALVAADPAKRVRELEAEVARLKMEREILKKAAAFFARESTGEGGRP